MQFYSVDRWYMISKNYIKTQIWNGLFEPSSLILGEVCEFVIAEQQKHKQGYTSGDIIWKHFSA